MKSTSSDPRLATRQEKILHGVLWGLSYHQARELSEREGRPILIFFSSINDANGRQIEVSIMPRADVVSWLSRFVTVKLHTDYCPIDSLTRAQREKIGEENLEFLIDLTSGIDVPQFAVVNAHGNLVAARAGACDPWELIDFLKTAESSYRERTGPPRLWMGYLWAVGSGLTAATCLIAIWTMMPWSTRNAGGTVLKLEYNRRGQFDQRSDRDQ